MKIKALQCFWAIVENGFNVTSAAEKLHLSQPAVSKQIKTLEDRLGMPIFRRQNKQFTGLTEAGAAMLPEVEIILNAVQRLQQLSRHPSSTWLELTLATSTTLVQHRLQGILPAWQAAFPQTTLHLVEGSNAQILQMLQEREADLAWLTMPALPQEALPLRFLALEQWQALLIIPKNHPLANRPFNDLRLLHQQPLVGYINAPKEPQGLMQILHESHIVPRLLLTARNAETIKNYVRQGLGLGVIADIAYDAAADEDLIAHPLSAWLPPYVTYLAWHQDLRLREPHFFFLEQLRRDVNRHNYLQHVQARGQEEWSI